MEAGDLIQKVCLRMIFFPFFDKGRMFFIVKVDTLNQISDAATREKVKTCCHVTKIIHNFISNLFIEKPKTLFDSKSLSQEF